MDAEFNDLLSHYSEPYHKARLLAAAAPHSGDWLHTLPISACGLHLEDNTIRVAVGLRLGCAICETHACLCGATVDSLGQHALSCKKNAGSSSELKFHQSGSRHAGLSWDVGKRPDGLKLVPWQSGHSATWDVTVVHTLAASYVSQSAIQTGSAATAASVRKSAKYSSLSSSHVFCPVAVETLGPLADDAQLFLTEIDRRATLRTADLREGMFLYQWISVAIQRFNAVCLTNLLTVSESRS